MTRFDALVQVAERLHRGSEEYGTCESNFRLISDLWCAYCDAIPRETLYETDVCALMVLLKLARIATGTETVDSWRDVAGYAACAIEVMTGGKKDEGTDTGYVGGDRGTVSD